MFKNLHKLDEDELIYLHKLTIIHKLVGDMAHEFNNHLGGIEDCTRVALEDGSLEVMKKTLEITLPVAERGCSLTRMLTDFARAKSTGLEEVDLAGTLEKALTLRNHGLLKKGIEITKEYSVVPKVWLNSGKILQIFLAMVMNAEESMENGGTLAISLGPFAKDEIEISFKHSGKAREGTLGLVAVQKILKEQGGQFHLESDEEWTTFTLKLPLGETSFDVAERAEGELESTKGTSRKNLSILIVEDNEAYRKSLSDLLNMKGHKCEAVPDAEKALERVKSKDYDLVFVDIYLPKMDGFELSRLLKRMKPSLRVVFVTGDTSEETIDKIKKAGVLGYFTKPCNLKEIFELVDKVACATGSDSSSCARANEQVSSVTNYESRRLLDEI